MGTDPALFWAAVETLADSFRESDPQLTGTMHDHAEYFTGLTEKEQLKLRHDVELVTAHFSRLPLSMSVMVKQCKFCRSE
jgi:hypothetical protein